MDWEDARRFLALIGRREGEPLVLAVFPPADGPCIHLPGDLGDEHRLEVERTLRRHPSHSLGLVVNPAAPPPDGWGSKPEEQRKDGSPRTWGASNPHIGGAVGIWAECDGGLPIEEQERLPARAGLPEPTLRVWSGGKSLHMYWLCPGGERLGVGSFRALQRHMAAAINGAAPEAGADRGICNPARLMRLPGGLHPKTGQRCRLQQQEEGRRYRPEDLEALLPAAATSSASSSSSSSTWDGPSMGGGSGWFDRLAPERQQETAVGMLRHLPLRTEGGQGLYNDSLKVLAGLVHHFGPDTAAALCERAGWRSDAWDPSGKVQGLAAEHGGAEIGTLIAAARAHGWRHPLDREQEQALERFGIEEPDSAAPPPPQAPPSFADRWAALEAAADGLAASEEPTVRVMAELAEQSSSLDLRLSRRDLEHVLAAAQRRLRPTADPLLPGQRFRVNPSLWVADGLVRHGLNLLVGQSGAGKTRLALALAAAWLEGHRSWLGLDLTDEKPIEERELLILGSDQSREDWAVAMAPLGLVRDLGEGERELHPRVTLHTLESGAVLDADGLRIVRRWCDEHPGGMVLADSLAMLLPPGTDEDKAAAARPVHALAEALGSCWGLLLHHTRKAAGREGVLGVGAGRGSGAIDAAVSRVLGLGLLHKLEHGVAVPQESDPRRELISTKRGGPTVHLIVSSDASGAWTNEGSAEDLKREERRDRALQNLTDGQAAALGALEEAQGQLLTTRAVFEAQGSDWEEDKAGGGAGAATLRKVLRRLVALGLVESHLAGNERTYRVVGSSSSTSTSSGIEDAVSGEPEGGEYESPERLADIREERIPPHVREERDANRLWEAQHRQRTERGEALLERQAEDEPAAPAPVVTLEARRQERQEPALPEVGEEVELADGRNGWSGGWIVEKVSEEAATFRREGSRKTATRRLDASPPKWRRPDPTRQQQSLLLAG